MHEPALLSGHYFSVNLFYGSNDRNPLAARWKSKMGILEEHQNFSVMEYILSVQLKRKAHEMMTGLF
jgi:hypothetical protein